MLSLQIGWRNLKRRRFRSILTGLMFFVGTWLLVFFVGLAEGTYDGMLVLGTRVWSGDFQIMEETYKEKPTLFKTIPQDEIKSYENEQIQALSPRIETFGLLAHGNKTIGTFLIGLDPELEGKVSGFTGTIQEGGWWGQLSDHSIPVVVGIGVMKRLKIKMGDELSFVTQAADGSLAADLFTVCGILNSGISMLDREAIFIPLSQAQELLVLEGQIHKAIGIAKDRSDLSIIHKSFMQNPRLASDGQTSQSMFLWNEIMPELENTIKADRQGLYLFLFIIMIVVLLGVANTMMMSVMERTFECGLLQALGTSPLLLLRMILAEIFWIAFIGVGLGILMGVFSIGFFSESGVPMGGYSFTYGGVLVDEMIPINTINGTLLFPLWVFLSGIVSGLIPAIKATRLLPAKAMGRTL